MWLTFAGPHQAGHYLGGSLDGIGSPSEDHAQLEDVYATVDDGLRRVLAALPDDADVIAFAPLGMTANRSRTDLLPRMLAAVLSGSATRTGTVPGGWIWRARALAPAELRAAVTRPLPAPLVRNLTARLHLRGVDWGATRAFALPGDHSGYVRVNVRGRERDGIVDPNDVEALMNELTEGLATFHEEDGAPVVAAVHRIAEELGPGARITQLPDLVVEWSARPSVGTTRVHSPRFGTIVRHGNGSARPGNHTPEAWAVIAPGKAVPRAQSRPPMITDIAATACWLLGGDMTGLAGEPLLDPA